MAGLPTLDSEGLRLRPWILEDAPDLHREIQDSEIVKWLNVRLPYTIQDAEDFVSGCPHQWERRNAAHFVIADSDDAFLGYIGVLAVEEAMRVVEIVYWVAASARGDGIAGRAVRLLLPWVSDAVGPEHIELGMLEGNMASARTAESSGFVLREIKEVGDPGRVGISRELIYELPI